MKVKKTTPNSKRVICEVGEFIYILRFAIKINIKHNGGFHFTVKNNAHGFNIF